MIKERKRFVVTLASFIMNLTSYLKFNLITFSEIRYWCILRTTSVYQRATGRYFLYSLFPTSFGPLSPSWYAHFMGTRNRHTVESKFVGGSEIALRSAKERKLTAKSQKSGSNIFICNILEQGNFNFRSWITFKLDAHGRGKPLLK